ncbi:hypothetical protein [Alysiella crassa]|uniref:Transmembrane protein n=1 Tax=Alysiella crassa TaxID=153491 RepID=A0A376BVE0_9NEIS|nr:hypothetical protein [Alysiella crassa]UOP06283.1 hypothetical protein LVJ80_10790 [Alysiella crassa]SSY80778.1 Uncharacterised protein [Alysiella crassa]
MPDHEIIKRQHKYALLLLIVSAIWLYIAWLADVFQMPHHKHERLSDNISFQIYQHKGENVSFYFNGYQVWCSQSQSAHTNVCELNNINKINNIDFIVGEFENGKGQLLPHTYLKQMIYQDEQGNTHNFTVSDEQIAKNQYAQFAQSKFLLILWWIMTYVTIALRFFNLYRDYQSMIALTVFASVILIFYIISIT